MQFVNLFFKNVNICTYNFVHQQETFIPQDVKKMVTNGLPCNQGEKLTSVTRIYTTIAGRAHEQCGRDQIGARGFLLFSDFRFCQCKEIL